jgi:formate-dependent nitrite reductase membrane component NrfD
MFARPVICGAISAVFTYGAYIGAKALWGAISDTSNETRIASLFILAISGIALVVSYVVSVLVLRAIKEDEVRLLPFGNRIAGKLISLGWLKKQNAIVEE